MLYNNVLYLPHKKRKEGDGGNKLHAPLGCTLATQKKNIYRQLVMENRKKNNQRHCTRENTKNLVEGISISTEQWDKKYYTNKNYPKT